MINSNQKTMKNKFLFFLLIVISQNFYAQINDLRIKDYYEEIKIEVVNNKIIVPVRIKGREFNFILDTGSSNIISTEIYNLIKPKILKKVSVKDASKKKETLDLVLIDEIKLGNISFKKTEAYVYNLRSSALKCFHIDGFIGSNMFDKSILQIDLDKKIIRITDNKKNLNLNKKHSSKIKLIGNHKRPYIWIKLQGENKAKEQVLFDTGMAGLYDLSLKNYEIFKTTDIYKLFGHSKGASALGLFGNVPAKNHYRLLLPKLSINNFEINNYITNTVNSNHSRIGAELLKYGIVTIDFINERFYFNPKIRKIDINDSLFGFSKTLKNNKLVVGFVWDKNLKNKIYFGDEITEINDVKITEDKICELIIKKWHPEKSDSIKLKVKSKKGKIFELVINKKLLQLK